MAQPMKLQERELLMKVHLKKPFLRHCRYLKTDLIMSNLHQNPLKQTEKQR